MTDSMQRAIDETSRRRVLQEAFNREHHIQPEGIHKAVRDITASIRGVAESRATYEVRRDMPKDELARVIKGLEQEMKQAAKHLEFEKAAMLRDETTDLKKILVAYEVVERGSHGGREPARSSEAKWNGRRRR